MDFNNAIKLRMCLAVFITLLLMSACGGGGGGDGGNASTNSDVNGTWSGTVSSNLITPDRPGTLNLTQTGNNLTGTLVLPVDGSRGAASFSLSGTITGNKLNFALTETTAGCSGTFTGNGTVTGTTMTTTFNGSDCTGTHTGGQTTFTKQSSAGNAQLFFSGSGSDSCGTIPSGIAGLLCSSNPVPSGSNTQFKSTAKSIWRNTLTSTLSGTDYGVHVMLAMPGGTSATARTVIDIFKSGVRTNLYTSPTFVVNSSTYTAFTATGKGTSADAPAGSVLEASVECVSGCSPGFALLGVLTASNTAQTSYIDLPTVTVGDGVSSSGAPTANAGADQSVAVGTSVTLDGMASSDPNGDVISYLWALTSKPAGSTAALSSVTIANPNLTVDVAGAYVLALIVSDGVSNSVADTVTINANAAVVALDGVWSGVDSKGQPVSITVVNDKVTKVSVAYDIVGNFCTSSGSTSTTFGAPLAISGNQFIASATSPGPTTTSYTLSGTFAANNTATGTLQTSFNNSPPNSSCSGSSNTTWTATKQ